MLVHGQNVGWGLACTVKQNTVKYVCLPFEHKNEKTHKDSLKEIKASVPAVLDASKRLKTAVACASPIRGSDFAGSKIGIYDKFDELDWEGPDFYVPNVVPAEAEDGPDEVDWEGPDLFVPLVVPCANTGAGSANEMLSSNTSLHCHVLVAPEPQLGSLVPDLDMAVIKQDCEEGSHVPQPSAKMIAAGPCKEEAAEKTAHNVAVEEASNGLVVEGPLVDLIGTAKDRPSFSNAVNIAIVVLPSNEIWEPTLLIGVMMISEDCIAQMLCVLLPFVIQMKKLFQLERFKAFKRKRWKLVL